jgi:class 3 adenylate cyclase
MARIQFSPEKSDGVEAVVVSFDLCGFSDFCNQADAYYLLPKFIAALFGEVDNFFLHWIDANLLGKQFEGDKLSPPDFMKYTGDGALMIWFLPEDVKRRQMYCTAIVQAMRKLQQRFSEIIPKWEIEWQTHLLPNRARFGIAIGLVYPLREKSDAKFFEGPVIDYAGYCINLAVRLQNHCPEVGFIIHEPILPKIEMLSKWIAHGMKGTRSEPVLIFADDMELPFEHLNAKFSPIGNEPDARLKAIEPENPSERHKRYMQPRFQALLLGPDKWRQDLFFDKAQPQYMPIMDVKDAMGKVIGQEVYIYKLISHGPPLTYQFVGKKPWPLPPKTQ